MKISTILTITNPERRRDPWKESIRCQLDFADEVVVVCGDKRDAPMVRKEFPDTNRVKTIYSEWPYKWDWSELPKHMNLGLDACTGNIAMRMDCDYFIHEDDINELKKQLAELYERGFKFGKILKTNVANRESAMIKSRIPIIMNMDYKDKIRFGKASNKKTDWCMPIINIGSCKEPEYIAFEEWEMPGIRIWVYNYDYFFATKEMVKEEFWRFAQAYSTTFDKSWGETKEKAWEVWSDMMKGRLRKATETIKSHPKYIVRRIGEMVPEQWGHSNFGW